MASWLMGSAGQQLAELDWATRGDVVRAAFELGLARLRLRSHSARTLFANPPTSGALSIGEAALVERVAYVIPRVAARLPWRADCLVQAIAARRWLGDAGIVTTLSFGVPGDKPANFEAHAWLTAGQRIVTGGDISAYLPLA